MKVNVNDICHLQYTLEHARSPSRENGSLTQWSGRCPPHSIGHMLGTRNRYRVPDVEESRVKVPDSFFSASVGHCGVLVRRNLTLLRCPPTQDGEGSYTRFPHVKKKLSADTNSTKGSWLRQGRGTPWLIGHCYQSQSKVKAPQSYSDRRGARIYLLNIQQISIFYRLR